MDEIHQKHRGTSDQQRNFKQPMTTLANINPQEVNPEGAESPLQQTPVQAAQGVEKTASQPASQPAGAKALAEVTGLLTCWCPHFLNFCFEV